MEKERKITAPDGCEIEKVELIKGVAVVTFREKERKLPKSFEEFCETNPITGKECFINDNSVLLDDIFDEERDWKEDRNLLPDRATAEAVLSLCQLIQLRDCYNGDWVPDWTIENPDKKYVIEFFKSHILFNIRFDYEELLYFKTAELRDEFLRNFRYLIEKLKPLYGIKEEKYIKVEERGGEE